MQPEWPKWVHEAHLHQRQLHRAHASNRWWDLEISWTGKHFLGKQPPRVVFFSKAKRTGRNKRKDKLVGPEVTAFNKTEDGDSADLGEVW